VSCTHDGEWLQVSVRCPPIAAEAVAALMLEVVPSGVSIEQSHDTLVSVYIRDDEDTDVLLARITELVDQVDASLTHGRALVIHTQTVYERDWAEAWKRHYHCMRIGQRLVITPTWEQWPPSDGSLLSQPDDIIIEVDPGMAFGTGQHATTRLCLEAIECLVQPGDRAADIGCGSGILAIATTKLGAAQVLATDVDPLAVQITRRNCKANGVAGQVTVRQMAGLPQETSSFDLIVANISAEVVGALVPDIALHLAPDGFCVLSGFTDRGANIVCSSLAGAELTETERTSEGEWLAIIARRGET